MDRNQYSFDNQISQGEGATSLRLRMMGSEKRERRWKAPANGAMHFLSLLLALMIAVYAGMLFERFQSAGGMIRHLIAAAGCPAARLAGVAPSVEGFAGYWPYLDSDHNGVSCEK